VDLPDRLRDVRRRRSFQEIASRAAANRTEHVIVRVVGGEDDDLAFRAGEGGDAVDGVGVRQLEIEEDDVGGELGRQAETLGDRADAGDDPRCLARARAPPRRPRARSDDPRR
jgi:hypothetical protein